MLAKLSNLDRRWIFFALALCVIIPLVWPLQLRIEPSPLSIKFYETVENLPENSCVCMSFDYGPGTKVECHPMAVAMLRHLFRRKCKVVCIALWPEGSLFAREALQEAAKEYEAVYGEDYVNLGYKNGGEVILKAIGEDFGSIYTSDFSGRRLSDLPIMNRVVGWDSFDLVCDWSMGRPGLAEFVRVVVGQYNRPLLAGTTAVTTPEAYPFLNSGQLIGLLGGLRGASEYEVLIGMKGGQASRGIDAQSMAHFFVAFLIVLANLIYFAQCWHKKNTRN
ncbi:MAG: hypothetical protein ACI376_01860 [Candidatus Bruticola sp.]